MQALIYRSFGNTDVLEWAENWPIPAVTANQVLVRVVAGSVNPKDILLRKGKFSRTMARDPLPRVSGMDIAGEVAEVGPDVTEFSKGDRVFGMTNRFSGGVHAEFAVFGAGEIAHSPSNVSLEVASSIPLCAQTALQALRDQGGISTGHRVLINGASGGVGHFAVQIAKIMGAEVLAVCGSRHLEFVASLGADKIYNYAEQKATKIHSEFDCVFDVFGRFSRKAFAEQLGRRGVYVSTVPNFSTLRGEFLARAGLGKRNRLVVVRSRATDLIQLRQWIEEEKLIPHMAKVYLISDAADAHLHIERRHTTGKIVLSIQCAAE